MTEINLAGESNNLQFDSEQLDSSVKIALAEASHLGATSVEAVASVSQGLGVSVRYGELETVEHTRDRSLVVSVYFGNRTGSASTSDYTPSVVKETVLAACSIAKYTGEDRCHGLADPSRLAMNPPDLDLYHPWNPTVEEALEIAVRCEQKALSIDPKIKKSEGASVESHKGIVVYGNSNQFMGHTKKSRQGISCSVIGQESDSMQRDYWYSSARSFHGLEDAEKIGEKAAQRTLRRMGSRKIPTCQVPVIFEAPIASSLLSHLVSAISGSAIYRKASFLIDKIDERIFPDFIRIHEQPLLVGAMGSAAFDGEGVATSPRDLISEGVLQGYVLDSYSARRLNMETTGNSGGVHNLTLDSSKQNLADLIGSIDKGILLTELIGFGINNVTGDYSRGAAGIWIEKGELAYPVEEITVAGNLSDIFLNIVAIGNDVDTRRSTRCGSIMVDGLTVAGE